MPVHIRRFQHLPFLHFLLKFRLGEKEVVDSVFFTRPDRARRAADRIHKIRSLANTRTQSGFPRSGRRRNDKQNPGAVEVIQDWPPVP